MWTRLKRNLGWSLTSLAFVALAGFVSTFFNARALGVEGLGIIAAILAVSLMLESLAGMQCWQAVMTLPKKGADEARIFGAALLMNLATAAVSVVIGIALTASLQLDIGWVIYVHMATLLLRIPDAAVGILRRRDLFDYIAWVRILIAALSVVAAIAFWNISAPLEAYVLAWAAIQSISAIMLIARAVSQCAPAWPSVSDLQAVTGFSLAAGGSGAVGAARKHGIVLILSAVLGPMAVGLYTVADRIAAVMQMVYRAAFEAVYREMGDAPEPLALMTRIGLGALAISGVVTGFIWLTAELLITLVGGSDFASGAPVLVLLVIASAIPLITLGLRAWIIIEIGPRTMLICNLVALSALALAPWLMTTFGTAGAAYAQIAFELVWALAVAVVGAKFKDRLWAG